MGQLSATAFTMSIGSWYAWQMIPGYTDGRNVPYFSPIRVTSVLPKKTGKSILTLGFFNCLYASGVQDFTLDLRILKHEAHYLVAELHDDSGGQSGRCVVVSDIEFDWLRTTCPALWTEHPPERMSMRAQSSIGAYLDAVFGFPRSG